SLKALEVVVMITSDVKSKIDTLVLPVPKLHEPDRSALMNLAQCNDTDECIARPVADNTCLMFPSHSKLEWTFAVNAWIVDAMISCLGCGHFSDKFGRKKTLMSNCIFMLAGGVVQSAVSNIWLFTLGRLIAGIASGTATATIGAFVNALSPPHKRNTLGMGMQIFMTLGIFFPAVCFFFANTSDGWRYPQRIRVRAGGNLPAAGPIDVRKQQGGSVEEGLIDSAPKPTLKQESVFDPRYRMQLACGILLYPSISDPRIGTLIIEFINIWPAIFTGAMCSHFGARNMITWGLSGMFMMTVLMTVAFVVDMPVLSILFTALHVAMFGATVGSLCWVMTAEVSPDSICASASSLCIDIK
ncbi:hypothetical protein BBO99_00008291, partial [Phytophthora kernoviae]